MRDPRLTLLEDVDEPAELDAAEALDAPAGDEETWSITPRPITDGSQVIGHDG